MSRGGPKSGGSAVVIGGRKPGVSERGAWSPFAGRSGGMKGFTKPYDISYGGMKLASVSAVLETRRLRKMAASPQVVRFGIQYQSLPFELGPD